MNPPTVNKPATIIKWIPDYPDTMPVIYLVPRYMRDDTPERWRNWEIRHHAPDGPWIGAADTIARMVRRLHRAGYTIDPAHPLEPCIACGEPIIPGAACINPDCPVS